jgi:hypothetical protein
VLNHAISLLRQINRSKIGMALVSVLQTKPKQKLKVSYLKKKRELFHGIISVVPLAGLQEQRILARHLQNKPLLQKTTHSLTNKTLLQTTHSLLTTLTVVLTQGAFKTGPL